MTVPYYPDANSTISVGDLENQNIDRSTNPIVMTRGMAIKKDGAWEHWDGITKPYFVGVAEGDIANHTSWSKIGYNGDVDVGTEDMIAQGGTYTFPAAQGRMDIVSTSIQDDPAVIVTGAAGTGIHTVTLYYLDNTFTEKSEDINLNGQGVVSTVATDIYRVQNLRAKVCGTGGKAAGDITLSENGGTTYKYGYIATGHTRQRQCTYTVPKDKTLYITSIAFAVGGATKEKAALFTTLAKYDDKAGAIRDFFFPYSEVVIEDEAYIRHLEIPTKLGAGVDLKVQVRGLAADCVCTCTLKGWLET